MASPPRQLPKKGGWGSLLSGAVANLESRLDTILAEDSEASARQRASEAALKEAKEKQGVDSGSLTVPAKGSGPSSREASREASRTRVNDRLAERLAKATARRDGSQAGSNIPSRVASPANDVDSVRTSGESRRSTDIPRSVPELKQPDDSPSTEPADRPVEQTEADDATPSANGTLLDSGLPINPARVSVESTRPSIEITSADASARTSAELPVGTSAVGKSAAELEAEMEQMRQDYGRAETQRQEEMHAYLEKIDALQAKLSYLAKETVAAAREANAAAGDAATEKLAQKDEQIALLMEEGEKLSKTELRHLQTIKKLRAKVQEDDKAAAEVKKKLERVERAESDLKQRLRRAEAAERQANEKAKQIVSIERQVEELRVDRENASELIRTLTTQLKQATERAEKAAQDANSTAAEADRNKIASLENDLEDAQIEKQLVEDRARSEAAKMREDLSRQKERFHATEMELKNEIAGLETRVEALRVRAEEASSDPAGVESSVKLLRQIETLQSQYSLAKDNWETIEGSLTARVSQLEKERGEAAKREADVRKKAREAATKSRKVEDELEVAQEQMRALTQDVRDRQEELQGVRAKLEATEAALADAKADAEKQRKLWEVELSQRIEEEKLKWQRSAGGLVQSPHARNGPFAAPTRKMSTDFSAFHSVSRRPISRVASHEVGGFPAEYARAVSRRGSAMPTPTRLTTNDRAFDANPPSLGRHESGSGVDTPHSIPPTPSIEVDADLESSESPQRTLNDLVSASTAGAGPSVQLVERMSAAVRRLESEKASFKDELARLGGQRDEARDEVVALMREVEHQREEARRIAALETDMDQLRGRYEASLEMLGEREEEVQELRQDIVELKNIYRELVESKVGPAQ